MKLFLCAVALVLSAQAVSAADFDGSKKLICATTIAMDCVSGQECVRGRPADIGAPKFLSIDFAKKTVEGPKRTTAIGLMEKGEDQIVLQGHELGFGWTLALDTDGDIVVTLVNGDGAFVLFGSCTPL